MHRIVRMRGVYTGVLVPPTLNNQLSLTSGRLADYLFFQVVINTEVNPYDILTRVLQTPLIKMCYM